MGLQEDFDRLQAGEGHAQVGRAPGLGGVAPEVNLMGTRGGISAALKDLGRVFGQVWGPGGLGDPSTDLLQKRFSPDGLLAADVPLDNEDL